MPKKVMPPQASESPGPVGAECGLSVCEQQHVRVVVSPAAAARLRVRMQVLVSMRCQGWRQLRSGVGRMRALWLIAVAHGV